MHQFRYKKAAPGPSISLTNTEPALIKLNNLKPLTMNYFKAIKGRNLLVAIRTKYGRRVVFERMKQTRRNEGLILSLVKPNKFYKETGC